VTIVGKIKLINAGKTIDQGGRERHKIVAIK
jgi:hypothetical protein